MPEPVERPAPVRTTTRRAPFHQHANVSTSRIPSASSEVLRLEPRDGRTPSAALGWCIGEALDERMSGQGLANALALHAASSPMDQPDLAESGAGGGFQVGRDDGRRLARQEGVQVERVLDRDGNRVRKRRVLVVAHAAAEPSLPYLYSSRARA